MRLDTHLAAMFPFPSLRQLFSPWLTRFNSLLVAGTLFPKSWSSDSTCMWMGHTLPSYLWTILSAGQVEMFWSSEENYQLLKCIMRVTRHEWMQNEQNLTFSSCSKQSLFWCCCGLNAEDITLRPDRKKPSRKL